MKGGEQAEIPRRDNVICSLLSLRTGSEEFKGEESAGLREMEGKGKREEGKLTRPTLCHYKRDS